MPTMELSAARDSEQRVLETVRAGDEQAFTDLVEPYRRQLHVHCYRMLGSVDDADDALQETMLRAWRAREGFEGRALVRTWLYRIATNVCLDALARRRRRVMPEDVVPASTVAVDTDLDQEIPWLAPYPDALLEPIAGADQVPDVVAVRRETIELAYLAAIQHLPPRQRAILILRDALGWSAKETAELVESSVASVNSALQRARATLRERLPERRADWRSPERVTDSERAILARYMEATERADAAGFTALLAKEVIQTMPPAPFWMRGRDDLAAMARRSFEDEPIGDWRAIPVDANRQPGAAFYLRLTGRKAFVLWTVDVLTIEDGEITRIDTFSGDLIRAFNLPKRLPR